MRYRFLILVLLLATPATAQIIQRHDHLPGIEFGDGWVKNASKHHDWSVTGADTIHADRITQASITQHEGAIDHDSLSGFVANEHIDWTGTTENLSTTGTGTFSELILSDGEKLLLGTGGNASAAYASGNFVFDSAEVGTGDYVFNYGGSQIARLFGTEGWLGIGSSDTPREKLDMQLGSGDPGNLRLSTYGYHGLLYSSGAVLLGYNAKAPQTTSATPIVANTNGTVGYAYMKVGWVDGFEFHAIPGAVTKDANADNPVFQIDYDGNVHLVNDDAKFTMGAAKDADYAQWFDGTNAQFDCVGNFIFDNNILVGTTTDPTANATKVVALGDNGATDPTLGTGTAGVWQNSGDIVVGSATADKTLRLASPVYECVSVDLSSVRVPPANAPTWTAYKGSYVLAFSAAADEIIYFTIAVPTKYFEGGDLDFHAHVAYPDANAGDARWNLTHSWANKDAAFPAEITVSTDIAASGVADKHVSESVAAAISGTGKEVESVILCSLEREGTHANDDYGSSVYLVSMHFCMPVDTLGARSKTSK